MSGRITFLSDRRASRFRDELEQLLDAYFEFEDWPDQDADFEEGGDLEPSLGWTHTMALGGRDDFEES